MQLLSNAHPRDPNLAEVHGPLALVAGQNTTSTKPFQGGHPLNASQWLLCGSIGYSVGDAASAASAAALAELPGLSHTSELLLAERASELGGWIAQATDVCAANRKAVDNGLKAADDARDADVKVADAAHAERVRLSKLQHQADKAKANAKHVANTRMFAPAKLDAQERQLARVIAAHDETLEQLPKPSASSSSGSGGRKRKTRSTADPPGGASAAKQGKRPARTPTRPPEHFCSLTMEVMEDPAIAADGNTYERAAIETWFKDHDTSPLHGSKIPKTLFPNQAVKNLIRDFEAS